MIYVNETVWAERMSDIHSYYTHMGKDVEGMCTMTKVGLVFTKMNKAGEKIAFDTFAAIVPDGDTFKFVSCYLLDGEEGKLGFEDRLLAEDMTKLSIETMFEEERNELATKVFTEIRDFIDKHSNLGW